MQTQSFSQVGSIREDNQDYLLVDSELRFAIVADGDGAIGKSLAKQTATAIHQRLREIAPVTGGDENLHRLKEALELARQALTTENAARSRCDIAAIWINRGTAALLATGTCRLLSSSASSDDWREQREFALPVSADTSLLLASEGTATALNSQQLLPALNSILSQDDPESFAAFEQQTTAVYDGDDCSALLIRLDASDLTAGIPHEIELFEHYQREYSFKLWMPLAIAAGTGLIGLAAARKLKPVIKSLKSLSD